MKYLVLGSSGLIGNALCQYLKREQHEVFTFDINDNKYEDLRIYQNEILMRYMDECDFIFFLTFDVGGSVYLDKYQQTYQFISNNIKIMDQTFEALFKCKTPFIFVSSQMSNMNSSTYGNLKRIGEQYTKSLNGLFVKFWNVYGYERDLEKSHVIIKFILKAHQHKKIMMKTNGNEQRQFIHSDDASKALYTLSNRYTSISRSNPLHITSHKWISILDIAKLINNVIFDDMIDIIPSEKIDLHQTIKNEPDPYALSFWKPEINIEKGIKRVYDELVNHNKIK